jgi:hypothetical protein
MQVNILRVDQSYSLVDKSVTNNLVIALPSGDELRISVPEDVVRYLLGTAAAEAEVQEELAQTITDDEPVVFNGVPSNVGYVRWQELSDTDMPPAIKKIFTDAGMPDEISPAVFENLYSMALERLMTVTAPMQPAVPGVRRVGSPVIMQRQSRRSVPADDYGNPIVQSAGVDAGTVVSGGPDSDEDGVGQL